ncbi:hypothetical protein IW148_004145 [Coemansia sp. RSA 1199]|nr:hypothetical protein IW148_004145 [Coemansia sp. RSA 1199]
MPIPANRYTVNVGFPVGCIGVTHANKIVLGGGGGPSRSGVQNKLSIYSIDDSTSTLNLNAELVLSSDEDAPTCLAMHPKDKLFVCSINTSMAEIKQGKNQNCRLFSYTKTKITMGKQAKCMGSTRDVDYQKCIAMSASGKLVVGGATDGTLSVVRVPTLKPVFPFIDARDEINDVGFSNDDKWLVAATDSELRVLSTTDAELVRRIDDPRISGGERAVFRFARFGQTNTLYTVLNTRARNCAYIVVWDTNKWVRTATRRVSSSPITTFALGPHGLLAFATASLHVVVCDAKSLRVLMRVPAAHSFAITALAFDRDGKHLVSASADQTCQVYVLPDVWPTPLQTAVAVVRGHAQVIAIVFVLVLAILLALVLRR